MRAPDNNVHINLCTVLFYVCFFLFFFFNKTKEIYFKKKFLKLLSFSVKFLLYIGL